MNGKKCISLVLGFILAFSVVAVGYSRITTFVNEPNPNTAGTPANHTLKFTNTENIPLGGRIEIDFPAAFDLLSRSVGNPFVAADFNVTLQKPVASALPPSVKPGTVILNGNKLSFEVGDSAVDPGFQQIEIVNTKILNPPTPGNYALQLRTYDTAANNQRQIETASSSQFEIVSEMSRASVYPEPNRAGERAQYTIKLKLGSGTSKKLYSGDRIRIEWDANLIAGGDPTHATSIRAPIPKESITINGARPTVDPQFISEGIPAPNPTGSFCEMDLIIPNNINTTSSYAPEMTIVFSTASGIINPSGLLENRSINISIFRSDGITQVEAPLESNPYSLNTSLEAPEVKVQPDKIGTVAEYHCAFKVGDQGKLTANSGRVDVIFPSGTTIPNTISAYSIKIATPTPVVVPVLPYTGATKNVPYDPQISGNKVSFIVPETVLAGQYVCFIFTTDAGIRNPEIAGVYNLRLSTSQEPSIVTSQNYRIQGYTTTSVEVTPNKSEEEADWKINFNLRNSGGLYTFNNDTITLTFPEGTGIPLIDIPAGDIQINGVATTAPATVNPVTRQIAIFVPQSIEGGKPVVVTIAKQAKIIVPTIDVTPKFFTIKIEIPRDIDPFISDPFMVYTSVKDIYVTLGEPGIKVVSQQEILLTLGDVDEGLKENEQITIEFPEGTSIPSFINPNNVRIVNVTAVVEMTASSVQVYGRKVVVVLPTGFPTIAQKTNAKVIFLTSCGISNPAEPGSYTLTAYTSKETMPVKSKIYTIGTVSGAVRVSVLPNASGYCIPQPAIPTNGKGAEYEIDFLTGSSGGVASGQFVTVIFPPQYKAIFDTNYPVPTNMIPPGNILINNIPVNSGSSVLDAVAPYPVGSKMVQIPLPTSISHSSKVSIKFLKSADIDNPVVTVTPQPFTLYVYTATEPSAVSGIYYLYSKIQGVGATEINNDLPIQVALSSNIAGRDCGMDFGFETGPIGALTARVDTVSIMLPQETRLPSFIPASTILVDQDGIISGNEVAVLNVKIDHNIVTFTTPINVNNLDNLYVYFTEQSGMLNPSSPGNYQIFVKTSKEEVYTSSSEYTITPVSYTIPTVSVRPAFVGVDGIYTIRFKTGTYGGLNMGDTINLEFPADTTIPASIASNRIRVNNIRCNINPLTNPIDRTIQVYSPIAIKGNSNIEIIIAEDAHVKNPTIATTYNLELWTLREGSKISPLMSNEYTIYANTGPLHITAEISPCTPYTNAEYVFTFYTPVTIVANTTAIDITFPNGTFIPSSLDTYNIMFGSTICRTQPVVAQYTVTLVSPIAIGKNDMVTIKFTKDADIQNTSEGTHTMYFEVVGAGLGRRDRSIFICPDLEIGRIEITPDELRIEEGKTQTFATFVYDVNGNRISRGVEYRWNISGDIGWIGSFNDPRVEFYANSTGKGSISVTVSYGSQSPRTASATVTVVGGLENIVLTPSKVSTSRGNKTPFIVVAYDSYGELIENVSYTYSVSPALGKIQKMTNPNEITFLATSEGRCTLTVVVRQNDSYREAQAEIDVRNGVNDLRFEPASFPSSFEPSGIIGPITVKMTDELGNLISQNSSTSVILASSSTTTRFSQDGVTWTTTNKFFTEVSTNFSETMPFYVSELEQNNISITATSEDYNAAIMTLTIRGSKKKLSFGTPPRLLRVNKPSDPIIVNISDIFGNPFPTNRDIMIVLSADSQTVSFSKSSTTWISQNQIQIKEGTSTIEFYCMDSKEGSFNVTITHPLFGSVTQMEMVASPGSVSMPEINVTPSTVGATAQYEIGFTLGLDGELGNVADTITIRFPSETILPSYISAQDVYVNGSGLFIVPFVDRNNKFIRIVPPKELNGGQKVELIIKGVINPETEKDYHLSVFTSKQPTPSTSEAYHIGVSSLSEVVVSPNPVIAGEIASYEVKFTTGVSGELNSGDLIVIVFDYNFALPKRITRTSVVINGMIPSKDPTVSGKSIIIKLDRTIQALSLNEIVVTKEAGIKNPEFPGMYQCRLYTSVEQSTVESEPFQIVDKSALEDVKVGLKPATIAAPTELSVRFNLGPYGALLKGENIYLSLNNFVLPEELHGSFVSVNNVRLSGSLAKKDKVVTIPLSMMLANNQDVIIVFYKQAGIINPTKAGYDYRISIWTDKEPSQIMSEPFTVEPNLEIDCLLTPDHPDGLSGWFVTAPTAIFTSNVIGTFYYHIDNAQEKKYTDPIVLNQPGRHTLYYRIVTSMGTESEVYEVDYAYDGEGPEIVTNLESEVVYTRDKAFALSVKINDVSPVMVTLNQQPVSLIENTFSTLLSLKNGENILQIKAIDEAGNITFGTYRIIVKVNPPVLMVSMPQLYQTVEDVYFGRTSNGNELHANIRVKGSTEMGIDSVSVKSLTKNLEEIIIPVSSMGSFDRVIGMSVLAGDNVLQMTVVDRVGNTNIVTVSFIVRCCLKLRIGVENAYLNATPITLDAPPYLKYNMHTMVPFRVVAESFGATVGWEGASKKVSYDFRGIHIDLWIDNKNAMITHKDGRKETKSMPAEPELRNGRTLIPLRFVAEAMGMKVGWNAQLWEASLTYP
ncbi:MAG: copper amine oxidase N-terminal domain-containing protein [Caldisericia bacterium]|nr:copper amine oxidase N-terminal domain-containing protein [Caldisericia bacterium]